MVVGDHGGKLEIESSSSGWKGVSSVAATLSVVGWTFEQPAVAASAALDDEAVAFALVDLVIAVALGLVLAVMVVVLVLVAVAVAVAVIVAVAVVVVVVFVVSTSSSAPSSSSWFPYSIRDD